MTYRKPLSNELLVFHLNSTEKIGKARLLEITDKVTADMKNDMDADEKLIWIKQLEDQMLMAASQMEFEKAAKLRDQLFALRGDAPIDRPQPNQRRRRERTRK